MIVIFYCKFNIYPAATKIGYVILPQLSVTYESDSGGTFAIARNLNRDTCAWGDVSDRNFFPKEIYMKILQNIIRVINNN